MCQNLDYVSQMLYFYLSIHAFATVTTQQGALIIGGQFYDGSSYPAVSTVACYNESGWSRLDDLQSVRAWYRAKTNGDKVYIIGGEGKQ